MSYRGDDKVNRRLPTLISQVQGVQGFSRTRCSRLVQISAAQIRPRVRLVPLHTLYSALAKTAERGKFDALFLQDLVGVRESLGREAMRHGHHGVVQLDPWLVLASNAAATSRIGLVATSPTTYNQVAGQAELCRARVCGLIQPIDPQWVRRATIEV